MTAANRRDILALLATAGAGGLLCSSRLARAEDISGAPMLDIRDSGAKAEPGFNNTPAIQHALNLASTAGASVFIPDGVFEVSLSEQASLFVPSGVRVHGNGIKSIIRVQQHPGQRSHVFTNNDWKGGSNSCTVERLTIQCGGYGSYNGSDDHRINGVTFFNARYCMVREVTVQNGQGYGIWLHDSCDSAIEHCVVEDFGDCIELSGKSERNIVFHNSVVSSGSVPWAGTGIILFGESSDNKIIGNSIRGGFGQGITTVSQYGCARNSIIANNSINVYNAPAIELEGSGNIVQSNYCRSVGRSALLLSERVDPAFNAMISANHFVSEAPFTGSGQVAAVSFSPATANAFVSGNRIEAKGLMALYCSGSQHVFSGNFLQNEDTALPVMQTGEGIECAFQGNVFRGTTGILNQLMRDLELTSSIMQTGKKKYRGLRNSAFPRRRRKKSS